SQNNCAISVQEGTPPPKTEISNCRITPARVPARGQNITISVDVTATAGVASVRAFILRNEDFPLHATLSKTGGATYQGKPLVIVKSRATEQRLELLIIVFDKAGEQTIRKNCASGVQEAAAPVTLRNCRATPTRLPASGRAVTLAAEVTSADGVLQ